MRSLRSPGWALVALLAVLTSGCGDNPTGGGNVDVTPPGLAAVAPVDMNHLQVTFTESVQEATAEASVNYRIVERAPAATATASPGDPVPVNSAVLNADGKTVLLTTSAAMQNVPYDLFVNHVQDLAGNRIVTEVSSTFTGSNAPDVTPPVILWRSPLPNATEVAIGRAVVIQFSESMDYSSVLAAFSWTSAGGAVAWEVVSEDNATFAFVPLAPGGRNTSYTVNVGAQARDWAGNHLAGTSWSFRTTALADDTPPTLVSSSPANGATHVAVASNLSMTFSEALQPYLDEINVSPIGDGVLTWSTDGRTFTFDPYADLLPGTQYSVLVPIGGVKDLSGNGNAAVISMVFTTGAALASGSFAGTLGGDPASAWAANPAGAMVVAAYRTLFGEGEKGAGGSAVAGAGGGYTVGHIPDGTYWPFAIKDSNGDGRFSPGSGDAIGIYGVDFAAQTGEPDSVTIVGGGHPGGIDFDLYDPVALGGTVVYEGTLYPKCCYTFYVGVFDTTGFDPGNPTAAQPLFATEGGIPNYPEWSVNEIEHGLQPGTYYISAYMDANLNSTPDAGDPLALYESGGQPIAVTIDHGADVLGIAIRLQDPVPGGSRVAPPAAWPRAKPASNAPQRELFQRLGAVVEQLLGERRTAGAP